MNYQPVKRSVFSRFSEENISHITAFGAPVQPVRAYGFVFLFSLSF